MPNRPSKKWWDNMVKEVSDGNPDYSSEQVDKTVGDIFYHKLSPSEKEKAMSHGSSLLREAITMLAAEEDDNLIFGVDEKNNIVYYKEFEPGGKFPDNVVQYAYKLAVGKGKGDSLGSMDFGMYYKVTFDPPLRVAETEDNIWQEPAVILRENKSGAIDAEYYMSEEDAEQAWSEIERLYEKFLAEQGIGE